MEKRLQEMEAAALVVSETGDAHYQLTPEQEKVYQEKWTKYSQLSQERQRLLEERQLQKVTIKEKPKGKTKLFM